MNKTYFGLVFLLLAFNARIDAHESDADQSRIYRSLTTENVKFRIEKENDHNLQNLTAEVIMQLNKQNGENGRMITRLLFSLFNLLNEKSCTALVNNSTKQSVQSEQIISSPNSSNENLNDKNDENPQQIQSSTEQTELVTNSNNSLSENVPKVMSNFEIDTTICIKSVFNGEYLYMDKFGSADICIFGNGFSYEPNIEKRPWELRVYKSSNQHNGSFHLQNFKMKKYIQPFTKNQFDESERCHYLTVTKKPNEKALWYIIPASNGVKLKSAFYNDTYLTSCQPEYSYPGTSSDDNSSMLIWQIEKC